MTEIKYRSPDEHYKELRQNWNKEYKNKNTKYIEPEVYQHSKDPNPKQDYIINTKTNSVLLATDIILIIIWAILLIGVNL